MFLWMDICPTTRYITRMSPATIRQQIAGEVGALMGRRRLSARAVASAVGMSYSYFNRRINGHLPFTTDDLVTLAAYFDVPVTDLFGEESLSRWTMENPPEPVAA